MKRRRRSSLSSLSTLDFSIAISVHTIFAMPETGRIRSPQTDVGPTDAPPSVPPGWYAAESDAWRDDSLLTRRLLQDRAVG